MKLLIPLAAFTAFVWLAQYSLDYEASYSRDEIAAKWALADQDDDYLSRLQVALYRDGRRL